MIKRITIKTTHLLWLSSYVTATSTITSTSTPTSTTTPLSSNPNEIDCESVPFLHCLQKRLISWYQNHTSEPSWITALITLTVVVLPWCLVLGSLNSRARAMKAGRAEAEGLGQQPPTDSKQTMEGDPPPSEPPHEEEEDDVNAAPLHLHAMRMASARLKGQGSSSARSLTRQNSRGRSRSRSASPAPRTAETSTSGGDLDDMHSSSSSIGGIETNGGGDTPPIPPDILTDRMGFEELEPNPPHATASPHGTLTPVTERMSEDTLEDCHAFSDVSVSRRMSGSGSGGGSVSENLSCNNSVLETLDEEEDDLEDEEEEIDGKDGKKKKMLLDRLNVVKEAQQEREEMEKGKEGDNQT